VRGGRATERSPALLASCLRPAPDVRPGRIATGSGLGRERGAAQENRTRHEQVFDVISSAYERTSLIVTANLPFESWTEVLGSERLTGATLDRLTRRCQIIETKGESCRLRDAQAKLRRGCAGDSGSGEPRRRALEGGKTST